MDPPSSLFLFFLCSNHYQTNKKSIGENAQNTNTAGKKNCRQSLLSTFLPSKSGRQKNNFLAAKPTRSPPGGQIEDRVMFAVSGTSAAAEWCKENLKWAGGQGAPLDFRGPELRDMAALRGPQASYPAQILQFQMSTQS